MKKRELQRVDLPEKRLSKIFDLLPIIANLDCVDFVERNMNKQINNKRKGVIDFVFLNKRYPEIFGICVFLVREKYIKLIGPSDSSRQFKVSEKPDYLDQRFTAYYWEPTKK